jgi:hypothetical protein
MTTITCLRCGTEVVTKRVTRKYCSVACANGSAYVTEKWRDCRHCGTSFRLVDRGDANRQHCSKECAKNHASKTVRAWHVAHPRAYGAYRANQMAKDPEYERKRWQQKRGRIIDLLGGRCIVCRVDNPYWLHVDFIPGSRDIQYRHPRHFKYVTEHIELFRLLCANHHYELTLTGSIEGTDITQ